MKSSTGRKGISYWLQIPQFSISKFAILLLLLVACSPLPVASRKISLVADGATRVLESQAETVRELLAEAAIVLENLDRVSPPETAALIKNKSPQ